MTLQVAFGDDKSGVYRGIPYYMGDDKNGMYRVIPCYMGDDKSPDSYRDVLRYPLLHGR